MKQKIIMNTVLFVVMMGIIIGFEVAFGLDNILIGASTATAMLMFLRKDFSLNPIRTVIKLIIFNNLMGVVTFLASKNAILGIPLNFIFLFIMGYALCYNLTSPSFLPFNLQYVFMLFTPITLDKLPRRLLALTVGAIVIVLSQVLFNKNKIYKQSNTIFPRVCEDIIKKIQLIEDNQSIEEVDKKIVDGINQFRKFVYDKREKEFYFTEESKIKLKISFELEKINSTINELNEQQNKIHILNENNFKKDLIAAINTVKSCISNNDNIGELDNLLINVFERCEKCSTSLFKLKIINSLYFIKSSLYEVKELDKKKYNIVREIEEIPSNFKKENIYKESFRANSLKFSYAFRFALGITFSSFIVYFFNIREGKWIVYTVNSLIQPYYETHKSKTKDRFIATIIGIVVISIVFYFIKNPTGRTASILIISYILSFSTAYRVMMITTTVSAIGAAALHGDPVVLTFERLLFVVTGSIIAIILSKFVFPYKVEDAKRFLVNLYDSTINSQLNILRNLVTKKELANSAMKNEILRANMIEDKLLSNGLNPEDKNLRKYLDEQRLISMDIFDLYRWVSINDDNAKLYEKEKVKLDKLISNKDNISYKEIENIINDKDSHYSVNSKIAIIDYIEILVGLNRVKKFRNALDI